MVGFDLSVKNPNQDSKLNNTTDPPSELSSLPEFPDYSLPILDPFPDFNWSDDWIMDTDSSLNMPMPENPVSDCSDLKSFDFASSDNFIESSISDMVQRPIGESCREAVVEPQSVVGVDGKIGIKEEQGLGSLIEKELEKVSLVGASESLSEDRMPLEVSERNECLLEVKPMENVDVGTEVTLLRGSESNLKLEEIGDGVKEGSLVLESESMLKVEGKGDSLSEDRMPPEVSERNECLLEVKAMENVDVGTEVTLLRGSESNLTLEEIGDGLKEGSLVLESESMLKLEGKGDDGVNEIPLVTFESETQTREIVSGGEDSDSSDSESESESDSDSDTDTDSSSTSSSSSSRSEEEEEKESGVVREIEEGEIRDLELEEMLVGSDEDDVGVVKGPIKSRNEIEVLPPVPPVYVTLEPHHSTLPVGVILSIMGAKVVVEGLEKHNPLNEGSILWITETRSPLGLVDEIFGPVKNPYYIVRYNSDEDIPAGIRQGTPVSFVAEFADYVLNDSNLYKKGYDASGENDEEISDEFEFSDDEKEAEYRKEQRMAKNGGNDKKRGSRDFGNRKKAQHKGTSWKNGHSPSQPHVAPMGQPSNSPTMGQLSNRVHMGPPSNSVNMGPPSNNPNIGQPSYNPNQFHAPPVQGTFGFGNFACMSATGPASVPPTSQVAQTNSFTPQNLMPPNGVWMNGMTFQPQQHMAFPNGFQMNGMPPQQLNQHQHPPQMFTGFPNGMQIPQQFDPNQIMQPNMALPLGQSNFTPGSSTFWPGSMGQAAVNQAQISMGFQGPPVHASPIGGVPGAFPNGPFNGQSNEMQPSSNIQGNFPVQPQFNRGATSARGGRSNRRGRGSFSGRRGRQ